MKKYIVFLLAIVLLLALQSSDIQAGGFVRGGFAPRGFAGPTAHHFPSRSVIVINPAHQVVRFDPFAHRFVVVPRHFGGNTVISRPAGTRLHGFHGNGFVVGEGLLGGDSAMTVTGAQSQFMEIIQPQQPVHRGRYVQPRWVDGGYGVQVLQPGYWIDN